MDRPSFAFGMKKQTIHSQNAKMRNPMYANTHKPRAVRSVKRNAPLITARMLSARTTTAPIATIAKAITAAGSIASPYTFFRGLMHTITIWQTMGITIKAKILGTGTIYQSLLLYNKLNITGSQRGILNENRHNRARIMPV